jgi:SAM-dependent methyltransferase
MKSENINYSGIDNLEVMKAAVNYNDYLANLVKSFAKPGDSVVDFGAGSGTFAKPVSNSGYKIVCVETDPTLFAHLQDQGFTVVNDLDLIEDGSIDYLYSLNVLEHISEDAAVVKIWFKKLRPGGKVLVFVPAFQSLYTSMDRKVGHIRRYTRKSLHDLMSQAGLNINKVFYADSIGMLATIIYKILDNGEGGINLRLLKIYDRWAFPLSRLLDTFLHPFFGKNVVIIATK